MNRAVWFKVAQSGKTAAGLWAATDLLTASNSIYSFTIPAKLKPGQYIIRHEMSVLLWCNSTYSDFFFLIIIVLRFTLVSTASILDKPPYDSWIQAYEYPGAQVYPSCIQVQVTGSGTAVPPASALVAFPGKFKYLSVATSHSPQAHTLRQPRVRCENFPLINSSAYPCPYFTQALCSTPTPVSVILQPFFCPVVDLCLVDTSVRPGGHPPCILIKIIDILGLPHSWPSCVSTSLIALRVLGILIWDQMDAVRTVCYCEELAKNRPTRYCDGGSQFMLADLFSLPIVIKTYFLFDIFR